MTDELRRRRVTTLDNQTLQRFLLAAWGKNGQWYWTEVERIVNDGIEKRLIGYEIPFQFSQTLYGIEVYDDEGCLVYRSVFEVEQPCRSGENVVLTWSLFNHDICG